MTDTPETDELSKGEHIAHPTVWSFCRKFERERDEAREQRDRLAEALRKAISWGDSASHHILHRQNINWTYLNEAKEALQFITPNEPRNRTRQ